MIKTYKTRPNGFDSRQLHTYIEAKVGGKWFAIYRFHKDMTMVWLRAGHGVQSGFVDIDTVEEWKTSPKAT